MVSLTKFREDRKKIVDFSLIETFLASPENKYSPSIFAEEAKVIHNATTKTLMTWTKEGDWLLEMKSVNFIRNVQVSLIFQQYNKRWHYLKLIHVFLFFIATCAFIAYSVKWKSENPSLDSNPRPFLLVKLAQFQ